MVSYDRLDISKDTDINKTIDSKKYIIYFIAI